MTIQLGAQGPSGSAGAIGPVGPPGPTGSQGLAATINVGITSTGAPGSSAQVTNTGTSNDAVLSFLIPTGAPGPMGPQGPPGSSGSGGAVQTVWGETPAGLIDGSNQVYTSANPYMPNLLGVYLNGLRQRRTNDYSETGSQSFQFLQAPQPGDSLSIDYIQP